MIWIQRFQFCLQIVLKLCFLLLEYFATSIREAYRNTYTLKFRYIFPSFSGGWNISKKFSKLGCYKM